MDFAEKSNDPYQSAYASGNIGERENINLGQDAVVPEATNPNEWINHLKTLNDEQKEKLASYLQEWDSQSDAGVYQLDYGSASESWRKYARIGDSATRPEDSSYVGGDIHAVVDAYTHAAMRVVFHPSHMLEGMPNHDMIMAFSQIENGAERATDICNKVAKHVEEVFRRQPRATQMFQNCFQSALVVKMGILRVDRDILPPKLQNYTNMNIDRYRMMANDSKFRIIGVDKKESSEIGYRDGFSYNVLARIAQKPETRIRYVPLEKMRWEEGVATLNQSSESNDRPRYVGQMHKITRNDLERMFPEAAEMDLGEGIRASDSLRGEQNYIDRIKDIVSNENNHFGSKRGKVAYATQSYVTLMEEYISYDLDRDGYDELVCVHRVNGNLLSIVPVENNPYVYFTPFAFGGRVLGQSIVDILHHEQAVQTDIMRSILDSSSLMSNPIIFIDQNVIERSRAMGVDTMAMIATAEPGSFIPIASAQPSASMHNHINVNPAGIANLVGVHSLFENHVARQTGVGNASLGTHSGEQARTATGMYQAQTASSHGKEEFMKMCADGISELAIKVLSAEVANGVPVNMLVSGEVQDEVHLGNLDKMMYFKVHTTGALISPDQKIAQINGLINLAVTTMEKLGVDNPLMNLGHFQKLASALASLAGLGDPRAYVGEVSMDVVREISGMMAEAAQQPPPDEVMKQQTEMAKLESDREIELAKLQVELAKVLQDKDEAESEKILQVIQTLIDATLKERKLEIDEKMVGIKQSEQSNKMVGGKIRPGGSLSE